MRKVITTIIFSFMLTSPALLAQGSPVFSIINKTGLTIEQLFVSVHEKAEWGEDILGVEVLPADGEVDITFRPSEENCMCDLRIVDVAGQVVEWFHMDLCEAISVTLYWEEGMARADIDNGHIAGEEED